MSEDKLDKAFAMVAPSRRAFIKKLVISSGFAVPIVSSYSMTDLQASVPNGTTITITEAPITTT